MHRWSLSDFGAEEVGLFRVWLGNLGKQPEFLGPEAINSLNYKCWWGVLGMKHIFSQIRFIVFIASGMKEKLIVALTMGLTQGCALRTLEFRSNIISKAYSSNFCRKASILLESPSNFLQIPFPDWRNLTTLRFLGAWCCCSILHTNKREGRRGENSF